jgi:hypothetical protein
MNNKELYFFLGKCLSFGQDTEFVARFKQMVASDEVDWEKFVRLASIHFITPLLFPKFLTNGVLDNIPADLRKYLEEIWILNLTRNNKILLQIEEINVALNNRNINPIYLKGAGNLIDGLYRDSGERIMIDIDFLTAEEEFLITIETLRELGYNNMEKPGNEIMTIMHYPRMIRDDTVAGIEVHRLPVPEKYARWFHYNLIAGEMKTPSGYPGCRVLADKHKAMLCFIHSQLSHQGNHYGTISFKDVYDIFLLSERIGEAEISIPKAYIKKAADFFYLAGKLTETPGLSTGRKHSPYSVFLLKHRFNLASKAFYKMNLIAVQVSAYLYTFGSLFTSKGVRGSIKKKLTSLKWYNKHLNSWKSIFRS